jgi:hypothetical protein
MGTLLNGLTPILDGYGFQGKPGLRWMDCREKRVEKILMERLRLMFGNLVSSSWQEGSQARS